MLLYDQDNRFLIFAQNDIGLFFDELEIQNIFDRYLKKMPVYKIIQKDLNYTKEQCTVKSLDCFDHSNDYYSEQTEPEDENYNFTALNFILIGVLVVFVLAVVFVAAVKLLNIRI